ncbi:hypothetical protein [Brevundimonas sp.]|uniref:hypothetical protein n=1 Tax=Brevundimonas sp. TaxID=1871086 RepID=UPI002ED9B8CD
MSISVSSRIHRHLFKLIQAAYPARISSLVAIAATILAFALIIDTTIEISPSIRERLFDFKIAPTLIVAVAAIYATVAAVAWDYITTVRRQRLKAHEEKLRSAPFFEEAKNIALGGDALVTVDSDTDNTVVIMSGIHNGSEIRLVIISKSDFKASRALLLGENLDVVELDVGTSRPKRRATRRNVSKAS